MDDLVPAFDLKFYENITFTIATLFMEFPQNFKSILKKSVPSMVPKRPTENHKQKRLNKALTYDLERACHI